MAGRRKNFGNWGEEQACRFLVRRGFKIAARNYHTTFGEIDIVAVRGGDYYFIEVKTRADSVLANDLAVTAAKKYKMAKTVRAYCYSRQISGVSVISAGLIVEANRLKKTIRFRFCVYC